MKENKPTQTKRSRSKKTAKKQPTLLEAIERVVELSKDSKMSNDFLLAAAPEIGVLTDSYGITEQQAVLFCICMERGPRRVDYDDCISKALWSLLFFFFSAAGGSSSRLSACASLHGNIWKLS